MKFALGIGVPHTPIKGGNIVRTYTVLRDARVMRDSLRMLDNG